MTTTERRIACPERPGGQGLDANQEESGNRAIAALLTDPVRGSQTDLVITYRDGPDGQGAYEVWAARGMVRFQRFYDEGGAQTGAAATATRSSSRSATTRSQTRTPRRWPRWRKSWRPAPSPASPAPTRPKPSSSRSS